MSVKAQPTPIGILELIIQRIDTPENSNAPIPSKVILVQPDPKDAGSDQLFIDQAPIPKEAWSYDKHDKILRWRGAYGGGNLHIGHDNRGAMGVIGSKGLQFVSVQAKATARFFCDVALNCGASYIEGNKHHINGIKWDDSSPEWKNANWIKNRFQLTYSVDKTNPLQPPDFTFLFEDKETEAFPWDPQPGEFDASLLLGEYKGAFSWDLTFQANTPPPEDKNKPSSGPDSVYPYWMLAREDASAMQINGVLQIDDYAPKGHIAGFQGSRIIPMVAGYYQVHTGHAAFGIFGTHICLDGKPVHPCMATSDTLSWTDLPASLQEQLGLPANGTFTFDPAGNTARAANSALVLRRLSTSDSLTNIAAYRQLYTTLYATAKEYQARIDDVSPDMHGLLVLSPFKMNDKGAWGDAVQQIVREDMSEIMNSYIPNDMWKRLFPNTPQPVLKGRLAEIAASPVPGVTDPSSWYKSLSTAVLTDAMADGTNPNCQKMNGPRTAAWLKDEVANSKVYHAHSQLLFEYEWKNLNPTTKTYLDDQKDNAPGYVNTINDRVALSILDIDLNVATNANTPEDLIPRLKADVQAAGTYAKTNKRYWAFAFYTYNTAPAILGHIAMAIGTGSGSNDGTTLVRMIQTNIAVLTALDPSGYYAKQYNSTINAFITTTILPSMNGFTGEADDISLIKEYIKNFVSQNINNKDAAIAKAAGHVQAIIDAENFEDLVKDSLTALRSYSSFAKTALALPQIASQWETWFKNKYPRFSTGASFFGSVLIGGANVMSVMNLLKSYQQWDNLDKATRTQIVLDSIQVGLQIFAAVVKRGVRIYSIFNVSGMTTMQRSMSIMAIIGKGSAEQVNTGLLSISNNTARWLGDTAGSAALREEVALLMNIGEKDAMAVSWTAKVFGKNLDEFISTRLGPLLTIAGIALSIYFIADGAGGITLGSEIINIVGGALTLFAMAGGWLIEGGIIAAQGVMASIIAVAGPLAIIAAVVGLALMLWQMLQRPPDPVEQFVNDYVKPAGLYVVSKCSSIDYVIPYNDDNQNGLTMLGFSLLLDKQVLTCQPDGAITLTAGSPLPDCVWKVATNGLGLSQIATITKPKADGNLTGLALSLMSDHTISFQPKMTPPGVNGADGRQGNGMHEDGMQDAKTTVLTQTWLTHTLGEAGTTNGNTALSSLDLTIQPVFPDGEGKYKPSQAMGYILRQGDRLVYSAGNNGTTFNLRMKGLAPNFMTMTDLSFTLDSIPDSSQAFGPSYGLTPSAPMTFIKPVNLPDFLHFDTETGMVNPNGNKAKEKLDVTCILEMRNVLGSGKVPFRVQVEPSSV